MTQSTLSNGVLELDESCLTGPLLEPIDSIGQLTLWQQFHDVIRCYESRLYQKLSQRLSQRCKTELFEQGNSMTLDAMARYVESNIRRWSNQNRKIPKASKKKQTEMVNGKTIEMVTLSNAELSSLKTSSKAMQPLIAMRYICGPCGQVFSTQETLAVHFLTHPSEGCYVCDQCGSSFPALPTLRQHQNKIHQDLRPFSCEFCAARFHRKVYLDEHVMAHTGEKPFSCDKCNFKTTTSIALRRHANKHASSNDLPYKCSKCKEAFRTRDGLKIHKACHSDSRPHICSKCNASFRYRKAWRDHVRVAHIEERNFRCLQCDKRFKTTQQLTRHQMGRHVANEERPYQCEICEKRFMFPVVLKQHMRSHGQREFACDKCDAKYRHPNSLVAHQLAHTGERPHKCDECSATFTRATNLKRHMLIHKDVKAFHCAECDKKFRHHSGLQRHQRIHQGIKPYHCDACGKDFRLGSTLNQHKKTHHTPKSELKNGKVPCRYCDKRFSSLVCLNRHIGIKHPRETPPSVAANVSISPESPSSLADSSMQIAVLNSPKEDKTLPKNVAEESSELPLEMDVSDLESEDDNSELQMAIVNPEFEEEVHSTELPEGERESPTSSDK